MHEFLQSNCLDICMCLSLYVFLCVCVLCMCLCRQLCMCLGCVFDVCSVYISILFEQGVWFNCFHVCLCMSFCHPASQSASQSVSQSASQSVCMNIYNHSHVYIQENHFCSMPMCMYMYICLHMQFIQFVFDCCV